MITETFVPASGLTFGGSLPANQGTHSITVQVNDPTCHNDETAYKMTC